MNYVRLEDHAPQADALARTILGHTITVTHAGRTFPVQAHGSYEDGAIQTGFSGGIQQEIELMILQADMPTMPNNTTRIRTDRRPGLIFQPTNVRSDDTGRHWLFNLKQVAA
jgi:hypothetical protein